MKKIILNIHGMTCASCAASIDKKLSKTPGILKAQVNFAAKKALVEYDEKIINLDGIKKSVKDAGYDSSLPEDATGKNMSDNSHHDHSHMHHGENEEKDWKDFLWAAILGLPLILEMVWKFRAGKELLGLDVLMWVHLILGTIIVFYYGWRFHKKAFQLARNFDSNMDTLISIGTLTAFFYSLWMIFHGGEGYLETAAIIIVLILLGKYFEATSTQKAGDAMKKLLELKAEKARVIIDGREQEKDIDEVKVGNIMLVKPGEKIPLDGIVSEGHSSVNEAMLTGESLPVDKDPGSTVFGSTINENGWIKIKVEKTGEGTVLANIIKTMEEAQMTKAPVQRLADLISGIFVPLVLLISITDFLLTYYFTGTFSVSITRAISVLIIACPCALGLATPTAIMVGTGRASRKGILIKNPEIFERAKDITMILFDKTGTLTKGEPKASQLIVNDKYNFAPDNVLVIAGSLAENSNHPLSRAVSEYSHLKKSGRIKIREFEEIRGKGLTGIFDDHNIPVFLGNTRLLEEKGVDASWAYDLAKNPKLAGGSWLFVGHDKKIIGAIQIFDKLRPEAKKIVEKLKKAGLEVGIVSGDNRETVATVARDLKVDFFESQILPGEKAEVVKKLQKDGNRVAFVGDGINDAPSLVQADLGVAMGSAQDIAKEAGEIILLQNNLERVVDAGRLSRFTFKIIKQNLFWAFFYNVLAIPLAAFGYLNPIIAAAAMSFSSVSVVLNSLRIYRK